MADCMLIIGGHKSGTAAYGRPAKDTEKPFSDMLIDNQIMYSIVLRHLRVCDKHDPVAVLRVYLERRKTMDRFNGQVSSGLAKLALRYESFFKKQNIAYQVSLINEFLWRSGNFIEYEKRLSVREIYEGLKLDSEVHSGSIPAWRKPTTRTAMVIQLVRLNMRHEISDEELEKQLNVLEVMSC